jgi:hypothetical protein
MATVKDAKSVWTPLLFILKNKHINVKDYDYIEGKTNEKKMMDGDHPFIMYHRRFYQNPYLWARMVEENIEPAIDFILDRDDFKPDILIVRACLGCNSKDNTYPLKVTERYIEDVINNFDSEEELTDTFDCLITSIAESGRTKIFDSAMDTIHSMDIKPKFDNWGNAGNGDALYYAIDGEDSKLAEKLLLLGADPSKNDSMSFVKACKKAKYKLANIMMDKGINIHTKNDLAMRMIERNDSNNIVPPKEKEYRLIIINRFISEKVV